MSRFVSRTIALATPLAVLASLAVADSWLPPRPRIFASAHGSYGFKVLEPKQTARGQLFAIDADGKDTVIWMAQLVNVPSRVFVHDDGKRVVTVNTYARLGYEHSLVLYDAAGKVLADYKLEDLLTEQDIHQNVVQTAGSRHWDMFASFAFSSDRKQFVITLDWQKVAADRIETKKRLLSAANDAQQKRIQQEIAELESLASRPQERVIKLDLGSGKLEGAGRSR